MKKLSLFLLNTMCQCFPIKEETSYLACHKQVLKEHEIEWIIAENRKGTKAEAGKYNEANVEAA